MVGVGVATLVEEFDVPSPVGVVGASVGVEDDLDVVDDPLSVGVSVPFDDAFDVSCILSIVPILVKASSSEGVLDTMDSGIDASSIVKSKLCLRNRSRTTPKSSSRGHYGSFFPKLVLGSFEPSDWSSSSCVCMAWCERQNLNRQVSRSKSLY